MIAWILNSTVYFFCSVVLLKDGKYKPRLQGYHFLEFLKEDEALRHRRVPNNPDPEVDVANIHGIGNTDAPELSNLKHFV